MSDEDRIAELLLRWEDMHKQGQEVSADELCRDAPHLAPALTRRIHALKVTSWLLKGEDEDGLSPTSPPSPDDGPARLLAGRYHLEEKIAEGGFAEVWKGFDQELRRAVAVKLPKATRLDGGDRTERFVAEARRVARLKHPGVVPVFDVGRDGDLCFIVSEFVEGGSLADRMARSKLAPEDAARLVAEVAETLAYAHHQGFVHRDIKPGNILLDHHGRALLADFGISRSPDDGAEREGISFGTLAYMPPEQVEGQPVDHRSDIYSLGVVLYELLANHLPHGASDPVEMRRKIVTAPVPSLTGISKELENICRKCLSRDRTDRYPNASELAADLRRVAGTTHSSRRRLVALIGAVLLLTITVAAVISLRQNHQPATDQPDISETSVNQPKDPQPASASLEAALALGKLHFNNKEWKHAEAAFTEAINLNPECAEAYHRRAGCRFNAGRVKESLPDFDTAARLDPNNPEVFKNRGIAYLNLLRFDEALTDLRHALELDPEHPELYRKVLGQVYARRAFEREREKKWAEGVADMDEAIKLDPTNADYFDKRGSFRFNLRQYDEAVRDFAEAIRLDPNQPTYHLHRGYAYEALGKQAEAAEDYKKGRAEK